MRKLIYNIIKNVFKKEIDEDNKVYHNKQYLISNKEKELTKKDYEIAELEEFIGKPVILFESTQVIIGFIDKIEFITQAQEPVLSCINSLDNNQYVLWTKPYIFNTSVFNLLDIPMKDVLTITNKNQNLKEIINQNKIEISKKLQENGFYSKLDSYLTEIKSLTEDKLDSYQKFLLNDYSNLKALIEKNVLSSEIGEILTKNKPLKI